LFSSIPEKLKLLPQEPGVYLMKDAESKVIYVGKAASLRNRVRSYFQAASRHDPKTHRLVREIADFEYIVTTSEREALIVEDTLIKRHQPRYNIRLKDDKRYPYLKITDEKYPRLLITRRVERDSQKGARYFGPYTSAFAVREARKLIQHLFKIRTCELDIRDKPVRQRPCLDHYIGLCDAPCVGWVKKAQYEELVSDAALFLRGQHEELLPKLKSSMQIASEELNFERAARLRDQVDALTRLLHAKRSADPTGEDRDAIGLYQEGETCSVQVFFVRSGKLVGRERFTLVTGGSQDFGEISSAFITQYYSKAAQIPKEILLPTEIEEIELLESWLSEKSGHRVHIKTPQRGAKMGLIRMVTRNAELAFKEEEAKKSHRTNRVELVSQELEKTFGWEGPFTRIEGFDISNTQGSEPVASMVVFQDGTPKKSDYRRFMIKGVTGPDDFSMMAEAVRRRLERAINGDQYFLPLPDLVLIDGGKGQLSSARKVMWELGLEKIPTLGLAKEFEHLFKEGNSKPFVLSQSSPALQLLQQVRDEAHRFALGYHRQLRGARNLKSLLDDIPGVGPARKKALMEHFGSLKNLRGASLDELLKVGKVPRDVAQAILKSLKSY
jgi:excinuclease ABC subunit C